MAEFLLSASYNSKSPVDFLNLVYRDGAVPFESAEDQGGGIYRWTFGDSFQSTVEAVITVKNTYILDGKVYGGIITSIASQADGWSWTPGTLSLSNAGTIRDAWNYALTPEAILQAMFRGDDTIGTKPGEVLQNGVTLHGYVGDDSITGGGFDDTLYGDEGDDWLYGGEGNDRLYAGAGGGWLYGQGGDDVLEGGRMYGGIGNDTYVIGIRDTSPVIEAAGEGSDTVLSARTYALSANVEKLTLTGFLNISGTGNELANTVTGNAGNNRINGFAGTDLMIGGAGNDTYIVDNAGDRVVENAGQGTDHVYATVNYFLSANVERLTLQGTASINGKGNDLPNIIYGNAGNNILDGGGGADSMIGGAGNDSYIVDHSSDRVVENTGGGTDLVRASATYRLSANVENLILLGVENINGTGNDLANVVLGNAGKNILFGGAGNDKLTGGAAGDKLYGGSGSDLFIFNSFRDSIATNTSGRDTIADFSQAERDRIHLGAIDADATTLAEDAFTFIGTAQFRGEPGELRYDIKGGDTYIYADVNGNGVADFAILIDASVALRASDFIL